MFEINKPFVDLESNMVLLEGFEFRFTKNGEGYLCEASFKGLIHPKKIEDIDEIRQKAFNAYIKALNDK